MSDDPDDAVAQFLSDYNNAMKEYEKGYVDADATLSVIDVHIDELRAARGWFSATANHRYTRSLRV